MIEANESRPGEKAASKVNGEVDTAIVARCTVCKAPLTRPASVRAGVGPVCARKVLGPRWKALTEGRWSA